MLLIILYILLLSILLVILLLIFIELFSDFALNKVPYVPTNYKIINNLLRQFKFKTTPKVIYDLGAGDGRFLIKIGKIFPQAKLIGYELSPWPYLLAKIKLLFLNNRAKIIFKDFFTINLSDADIIFCYLGHEQMIKLEKKFDNELKTKTVIVCNTFPLPNWQPVKVIAGKSLKNNWNKLFIYEK